MTEINLITAATTSLSALSDVSTEFAYRFRQSRGLGEAVAETLTAGEALAFADLLDALGHNDLAIDLASNHYYQQNIDVDEKAVWWDHYGNEADGTPLVERDERINAKSAGYHDEDPDDFDAVEYFREDDDPDRDAYVTEIEVDGVIVAETRHVDI